MFIVSPAAIVKTNLLSVPETQDAINFRFAADDERRALVQRLRNFV